MSGFMVEPLKPSVASPWSQCGFSMEPEWLHHGARVASPWSHILEQFRPLHKSGQKLIPERASPGRPLEGAARLAREGERQKATTNRRVESA
jgi:hypothetical protein